MQKSGPSHLHFLENLKSHFRFSRNKTVDYYFGPYAPAQLRAEIEGLDSVESAEVDSEPGDFTIAIIATEGHALGLADDGIGGRYGGTA